MIVIKLKGVPGQFVGKDFTATKCNTAQEKADFANKMTKFILGGFQTKSFSKKLYGRLNSMFGHIAHYNLGGFYEEWFSDIAQCRKWAEHVTTTWFAGLGDPAYTWSDVEKALIQWMRENKIVEQLDDLDAQQIRVEWASDQFATIEEAVPMELHQPVEQLALL